MFFISFTKTVLGDQTLGFMLTVNKWGRRVAKIDPL